jgi:hypothetical protein
MTHFDPKGKRRTFLVDWRMITSISAMFVFGAIIIGVAFWVIIGDLVFFRDEVRSQTTAQICRSDARAKIDDSMAEAIASIGGEINVIGNLIATPMEFRADLMPVLAEANLLLAKTIEELKAATKIQNTLVEACNTASAEGEVSPIQSSTTLEKPNG